MSLFNDFTKYIVEQFKLGNITTREMRTLASLIKKFKKQYGVKTKSSSTQVP